MVEPIKSKINLTGYLESRQGGRSENQDFAGVAESPLGTLIVVCDGMGGMQGGSTASKLAVTSILEYVHKAEPQEKPTMLLTKAIQFANNAVWEAGESNPNLKGMGTTVTALLISDKCATVAHVGDSRIYQLRKGKKVYRSFDHSMVFQMVKKKVITEEQARLSAQSNIILRALGIKPEIEVETNTLCYNKGDRFILCSDGFWGVMAEPDFIALIGGGERLDKVLESSCNTIEAVARKKGNDYDNLTAAIIEVHQKSHLRPQMSKKSRLALIGGAIVILLALCLYISLKFIWPINSSPKHNTEYVTGNGTANENLNDTTSLNIKQNNIKNE